MRLSKIFKEPLLHFIIIGAVLFLVANKLSPPENNNLITVNKENILSYIQYKSKAFEPQVAQALLEEMSPEDIANLIEEYIKEEALFREAKAMGLDQGDFVIRQRMVQKMEFLSNNALALVPPTEDELRAYYESHTQDYEQPANITFTHVFINTKTQTDETAKSIAKQLLTELNIEKVGFNDAKNYGDRFLYNTNYVEQTHGFVKGHFGESAAATIFSSNTPLSKWVGPIVSNYGAHIVFISSRSSKQQMLFSDLRTRISTDLLRERRLAATRELIDEIVSEYTPIIESELQSSGVKNEK